MQAGKLASLTVAPIKRVTGVVTLPGSKSLSNRALLLAAMCQGETIVRNVLASDDTERMLEALPQMGVVVEDLGDFAVKIRGVGGALRAAPGATVLLNLGNAGTAMRPLAAVLAASPEGSFVLDGTKRMRERPIQDLTDALRQLGCDVDCTLNGAFGGCPPVQIGPISPDVDGGVVRVSGKTSSQFLSALLIAAPLLAKTKAIEICITDELISAPYVKLTIGLMQTFGVTVDFDDAKMDVFTVAPGQKYTSPEGGYFVEGDASSASYFMAAAAMTGGPCTVVGCGSASTQGDVRFASVLEQMGATVVWQPTNITVSRPDGARLRGIDVDCVDIPDAAMTLAAVALVADGPTTIRGVASWRVKETERMKAIVAETTKLGADVVEFEEHCVITPPAGLPNADVDIETYDDHRIAMTFALAACAGVAVNILDPGCTAKTFPTYFEELERVAKR
ncbi:Enolpyruvate transferase domain-containing protein [Pelagophyceae sp. CCMP2097]|nr:Enolpyruvate transferase domain-containing protein [Pelagophyceae sp. CCMP2097]